MENRKIYLAFIIKGQAHIFYGGGEKYGTDRMDDRTCDKFCSADRGAEKQSRYGVPVSGAGCFGRHFDLWHEPIFFIPKYGFYYSAESVDGFDVRISRNSGVFIASRSADFEYDIEISQNYFFVKKGLDKPEKTSYNRNYFKSPFGL